MDKLTILYIILFGSMFGFGGVALAVLFWAAKNGQMNRIEDGSKVIFDKDEEVGKPTDSFPAKTKKSS